MVDYKCVTQSGKAAKSCLVTIQFGLISTVPLESIRFVKLPSCKHQETLYWRVEDSAPSHELTHIFRSML